MNRENTETNILNPLASLLAPWYWIHQRGYLQGVFWAIMVCLVSSLNDVFTRLSGTLDSTQITFFRFFFSLFLLVPVLFYYNPKAFKTTRIGFHSLRSVLLYGAIAAWTLGVTMTPLTIVSVLAQTTQLFVLFMALVFLREKVGWQRSLATMAGFIGIIITIQSPDSSSAFISLTELNYGALWLLIAVVMFAGSDILNKIMVTKAENTLTMMFYISLGTTLISIVPAYLVWQTPTIQQLFWLLCLGAGANLILYCLLKAFAATDISAIAPYRYVELLFAAGFGYTLFSEIPNIMTLLGAAIIIPSTLIIAVHETRKLKTAKS